MGVRLCSERNDLRPGKKAALSVSYDTANQKINVTVQNGFRAVLNGVDFPQIVGKDGTVHPPLTAQTVLLSFRLTGPDGVERVTGDYPIRIPGLHSGKPAHPKALRYSGACPVAQCR